MAKFCTSCGSPVEPDQIFCTACGAVIASDPSGSGADSASDYTESSAIPSSVSETNQIPRSYVVSPSSTSPMPPVNDSSSRQFRQPSQQDLDSSAVNNRTKTILIVVIAVLAVILCVLVGVLLGNGLGGSSSQQGSSTDSSVAQSQSQSQSAGASTSSDTSSSSANAASSADQSLYNELNSYYSKLGNYDSQIASAATTFNSNFLKKDMSTRRSYAKEAESILSQVKSDYSALKSLSVSSSSVNYSSYNTMVTCYNDCVQRISVICESWSNSLGYSDPTGHEDAICAPLSRDKVGNSNKYYTEFQENYPNAKPVAP